MAARIVPGHWKGNLIKRATNRTSVGTLVERINRYVMFAKLDGNTAEDVLKGVKRRLKRVPESLRKTMTYNQGAPKLLQTSNSTGGISPRAFARFASRWSNVANPEVRELRAR